MGCFVVCLLAQPQRPPSGSKAHAPSATFLKQTPEATVTRVSQKGRSLVGKFKRPPSAQDRQMRRARTRAHHGVSAAPRPCGEDASAFQMGPKRDKKTGHSKDSESKMESDISATSLKSRTQ